MPKNIIVERGGHTSITLSVIDDVRALSGVSIKKRYQDASGNEYYVKEPKPRDVRAIFKDDVFFHELLYRRWELLGGGDFESDVKLPDDERTDRRVEALLGKSRHDFEQIQAQLSKYVQHVNDLVLSHAALEVIAPRIGAAIMGDLLVAPQNCLHLHEGKPLLISASVGMLEEFLSEPFSDVTSPDYWLSHPAPSFAELVKTEEQATILGQAYFVALLLDHYDLVNNINLSNFGYIRSKDGGLTLSIVDWGNCLGVGFGGLSADESAFSNPQFAKASKWCRRPSSLPGDNMGFQYVMPMGKIVYPLLPRQVVPNLFDLTAMDKPSLRAAQRLGFYQACDQAMGVLEYVHEMVTGSVRDTLVMAMSADDARKVKPVLPDFILCETSRKTDGSSLADIIVGRIKSLHLMKKELEAGRSLRDIAHGRLMLIRREQMLPSPRFFPTRRSDRHPTEPLIMDVCLSESGYASEEPARMPGPTGV